MSPPFRCRPAFAVLVVVLGILTGACAGPATPASDVGSAADIGPEAEAPAAVLTVGAIPDQDPEQLARLHGAVAERLATTLDVAVEYVPVTDYTAAVTLFRTGDLDLVWFGGLTGVQARLQVPGSRAIAQRDIDAEFQSVFIAHVDAGIEPVTTVEGLASLAGHRITFGSESSTSGRLMPQHFLGQAGLTSDDFEGPPGFSGSHDATIDVVESGSYEVGALNQQVWRSRLEAGEVDTDVVHEVFTTPAYVDYHWLLRPDVDERFDDGFGDRVQQVLLDLDAEDPADAEILDLFGAAAFIPTDNTSYDAIEDVAADLGLLVD